MRCPRRDGFFSVSAIDPPEDLFRPDHTCSYCGSLSGEKFLELVQSGACTLTATNKSYKVYVSSGLHANGKFYFMHLNRQQQLDFVQLLNGGKIRFQGGPFYVLPFFCKIAKG